MDLNDSTLTAMLADASRHRLLGFAHPVATLEARDWESVRPMLQRVAQCVESEGLTAVGFVAYEAATAFDPALVVRPIGEATGFPPLLHFQLFERPMVLDWRRLHACPMSETLAWKPSVAEPAYRQAIEAVREHIRRGDTYQVNYTLRLQARAPADPVAFFATLMLAQRPAFGAFLRTADGTICSASPELFFQLDGDRLWALPMKGTAARGLWPSQDRDRAAQLRRSVKNRAENLMIVDMMRHDLGRIARTGSVRAGPLCALEPYPNVWQMVSRVACRTDAGPAAVFDALFPAASITGAPKARTMRIIQALETEPRGVYCGAIGYIAPGHKACFNVAIRTVSIDAARRRATCGVGGGIVWDSRWRSEYTECRRKAAILASGAGESFALLETLRWTPRGGFFLLKAHLARLRASARRFGFAFDARAIREGLRKQSRTWGEAPLRVRLRLSDDGAFVLDRAPLPPRHPPARIVVAAAPIDPGNPFLYHKTTRRAVYQTALDAHPEADDVLLWNPQGELTESCTANVLVRVEGEWLTPPVRCGLLAGTYRSELIRRGRIREAVIRITDVPRDPTQLRLINALRRSRRVQWALPAGPFCDPVHQPAPASRAY